MLEGIGEDLTRPGIKRTPERVASSMAELCRGLDPGSRKPIAVMSEADQNEMIIVKDISFSSMCEHHLLPYIGRCDIVYLPADDRIAGLSAIVELVENLAASLPYRNGLPRRSPIPSWQNCRPRVSWWSWRRSTCALPCGVSGSGTAG